MIVFRVSGKRFETRKSSVTSPLLEMLIREHPNDDEIFIDRDAKMFRWILYVQREGIIVDHDTVGVPEDIWKLELDYYQLPFPEKPRKLHSDKEEEQKLIDDYYIWKDKQTKAYEQRTSIYVHLMNYGKLQFVERGNTGPQIPDSGRTIGGKIIDLDWLVNHKTEFNEYANTLGYTIDIVYFEVDKSNSFQYKPASTLRTLTKHPKKTLILTIYYCSNIK